MGTDNEIWHVSDSDNEDKSRIGDDNEILSERTLELFQQIAKEGYIELKGRYPRRGSTKTVGESLNCGETASCPEDLEEHNIMEETKKEDLDR